MNKEELVSKLNIANKAELSEDFFGAAFLYKDALELAMSLENSIAIKLCKRKIVEMNKKSIASGRNFQEIEVTHEFTDEQLEMHRKMLEEILNLENTEKILEVIGAHPLFFPKVKDVEASSAKSLPLSHMLATLSTISDQGHLVRGGSLGNYSWFMQMYDLSQKLIMDFYIDRIMYMGANNRSPKRKFTFIKFSKYFSKSNIIEPTNLEIILVGLKHYFKKDYISAMHILVPQLESLIVNVAQRCGIDMLAIDDRMDIATKTRALGEHHFDSPEFISLFGEDFCRQVKFALFEQLGYKLRHKVAHGEINLKECNFRNTNLVIYFYLVLLAHVKVKNS